jgi:four helix bundle protein
MSDADSENTETQVSLDFILECGYITNQEYQDLLNKSEEVGRILNNLVENPEKFIPKH